MSLFFPAYSYTFEYNLFYRKFKRMLILTRKLWNIIKCVTFLSLHSIAIMKSDTSENVFNSNLFEKYFKSHFKNILKVIYLSDQVIVYSENK